MSATIHRLHTEHWEPLRKPYYWPPIRGAYCPGEPPELTRGQKLRRLVGCIVASWIVVLGLVWLFLNAIAEHPQ